MTFICLTSPNWKSQPFEKFAAAALRVVPRIAVDVGKGLLWADGKSLDPRLLCQDLKRELESRGAIDIHAGVASVPVAAETAARAAKEAGAITVVPQGSERE